MDTHKLTNHDIDEKYRDQNFWLMRNDFNGAFAYWCVYQNRYDIPNIDKSHYMILLIEALVDFRKYIETKTPSKIPSRFSYDELKEIINEDVFKSIPYIKALNHGITERSGDFIDLGALARNVFYMILRNNITSGHI